MIAFATCVGHPEKLAKHATPGLLASMREPFSHMLQVSNGKDLYPIYEGFIRAAHEQYAEALVLMHDDLEFRDPELATKIRFALKDPSVAIAGCIGSRGAKSLRWWEGERRGYVEDTPYGVHDFGFDGEESCNVDTLDGMFLILSPWVLSRLSLRGCGEGFHGYAEELCYAARMAGKRVIVSRINAFHHTAGGITGDLGAWHRAEANFAERWLA